MMLNKLVRKIREIFMINTTQNNGQMNNAQSTNQSTTEQGNPTGIKQDLSLLNEFAHKAADFFDKVAHRFDIKSQSMEELMNTISPSVDSYIKKVSTSENLQPLGGEITISLDKERDIYLVMKTYYENTTKQIILKETTKTLPKEALDQASYAKLENGNIVFPIDPPTV